jgi:predicted DNA-binding protein
MPKLIELNETQGMSITFTKDQYAALVRLSGERRRAIAYLVREAVDQYLAKSGNQSEAEPVAAAV